MGGWVPGNYNITEVVWLGFGVSLIRLGTFVRLRTLFAWVSLVRLHFGWVVGSFGLLRILCLPGTP